MIPDGFKYESYEKSVKPLRIPYLKLNLDVPADTIYREWLTVASQAVPHRDHNYESNSGWYSLCLHGLAPDKTEHYTAYGYDRDKAPTHSWTEIADLCPETVSWIKTNFPSDNYFRIRFMLLKAGGKINWHKDNDKFILAPINISITHPEGCEMHWRKWGTQPWLPGQAYLMNVSYEHSLINSSDQDRLHIIIDPCHFNREFEDLIKRTVNVYL